MYNLTQYSHCIDEQTAPLRLGGLRCRSTPPLIHTLKSEVLAPQNVIALEIRVIKEVLKFKQGHKGVL